MARHSNSLPQGEWRQISSSSHPSRCLSPRVTRITYTTCSTITTGFVWHRARPVWLLARPAPPRSNLPPVANSGVPTPRADHTIRIWERVAQGGDANSSAASSSDVAVHGGVRWQCTAQWESHAASVWKLAWAHPEFGQVLASCSFDRSVAIWEDPQCACALRQVPPPSVL